MRSFRPPATWQKIKTIEMHTGGEPLRVILDGFPEVYGNNAREYRRNIARDHDHLRKALMWEPRGHQDMYGCLITPSEVADFGVVFMHNEGYSTMCGHATLALTRLAVDSGWVEKEVPSTSLKIEAPCGVLDCTASIREDGSVGGTSFLNVPSYVVKLDARITVPGIGNIMYDLAYGGAYYAIVDAAEMNIGLTSASVGDLVRLAGTLKRSIAKVAGIRHPESSDLAFLYGIIFVGPSDHEGIHSKNVCVFAGGEVDRSPTGSGVSARAAVLFQKGELKLGEWITIESILGTTFDVRVDGEVDYFQYSAVIPEVSGMASYTGMNEFWIDPDDALRHGFLLQ